MPILNLRRAWRVTNLRFECRWRLRKRRIFRRNPKRQRNKSLRGHFFERPLPQLPLNFERPLQSKPHYSVSWNSNHASADFGARTVNVKPSRIGSVRALLEVYEHCEREGVRMYGGGMGEVGVARGQIELLAALFHPDAPNDVAPSAYNEDHPAGDLPASPLAPRPEATGFRWAT